MTLTAEALSLGYPGRPVVDRLDLAVPQGTLTVVVGPNGCGKSTLLRGLGRLLAPHGGTVLLDGVPLHRIGTRELATRLGILPQSPLVPDEVTVADLVSRGRQPHQRWWRQWSPGDAAAVQHALDLADLAQLADRAVDQLSGGQRQRVWIAMALAQQTPTLLLDEPTTYLDLAHQVEVLDLLRRLVDAGRTVVAVLHDLNQAARYADRIVAMRAGQIVAQGTPAEVFTADTVGEIFGLDCVVVPCPVTGAPLVLPGRPPAAPNRTGRRQAAAPSIQ